VRAILYQQLAGPAAATIERRFLALYGDTGEAPTPEQVLATDLETFRSAGVSRQKAGYLLDLAAKTQEGVVGDHLIELPDDEVANHVMAVKGIGRWTADMLLIFSLGRPDVLPVAQRGQAPLRPPRPAAAEGAGSVGRAVAALPQRRHLVLLAVVGRGRRRQQGVTPDPRACAACSPPSQGARRAPCSSCALQCAP
jgi:hypothetical protein